MTACTKVEVEVEPAESVEIEPFGVEVVERVVVEVDPESMPAPVDPLGLSERPPLSATHPLLSLAPRAVPSHSGALVEPFPFGLSRTGPTTSIKVVDMRYDKIAGGDNFQTEAEDVLAACATIQGLVNRQSEEKVYLLNMPMRFYWNGFNGDLGNATQQILHLLGVEIEYVELDLNQKWPAFAYLLENHGDVLKGKVLCASQQKDYSIQGGRALAVTACSFEDGLMAAPVVDAFLESEGIELPTLLDTRAMNNNAAFDHLLEHYAAHPERDQTMAAHYAFGAQDGPCMFDYWVSQKALVWFMHGKRPAREGARIHELLNESHLPQGTIHFGVAETTGAIHEIEKNGYTFTYGEVANCSVTASVSFQPELSADTPATAYQVEDNAVFIAWNGPDGDAVDFVSDIIFKSFANNPGAGRVPMGLRTNPYLIDLNPKLYEFYANRHPNVELVTSMNDGGFSQTEAGQLRYAQTYAEYAQRGQGSFTGIHTFGRYRAGPTGYVGVLQGHFEPEYIIRGYDGYRNDTWLRHIDRGVLVCSQVGISDNYQPDAGIAYFTNILEDPDTLDEPLFLMARPGIKNGNHFFWWIDLVSQALQENAGRRPVYFVRPRDLVATYKAHEAGKRGVAAPQKIDFSPVEVSAEDVRSAIALLEASENYIDATNAIFALGRIGAAAAATATPVLIEQMASPDRDVRIAVVWALGYIGDPRAVEPMITLLEDPDYGVRWAAAQSLGNFGEASLPAARALMAACDAPMHYEILMWAPGSLARIGRHVGDAGREILVEKLVALCAENGGRYPFIAGALGAIAESEDVRAILPLLESSDASSKNAAAYAFGLMGPKASAAERDLKHLASSSKGKTKLIAVWALARVTQ